MGADDAPIAVADAGPLIHLHEIGRLPILRVFSRIYVPAAVWDEAVESLERLYGLSSLFVTRTLVDMAIEQLIRPI